MILLTSFESLKIFLKKMVTLLMATVGLLKIKVFWKKGYDVIISAHDATNKILLGDSIYIEDEVMWPRFGNPITSMREVIITSILQGLDQKKHFFWGVVLVQVQ